MAIVEKRVDAILQPDGSLQIDEQIHLNHPVKATVIFTIEEDAEQTAHDKAVDEAATKVFARHHELFRKLAQ